MTGVTTLAELATLTPERRPTHLGADLSRLGVGALEPEDADGVIRLGGWTAEVRDDVLAVQGDGDVHAWWNAAAHALWRHRDTTGRDAAPGAAAPPR
jgi:hypothetical protein